MSPMITGAAVLDLSCSSQAKVLPPIKEKHIKIFACRMATTSAKMLIQGDKTKFRDEAHHFSPCGSHAC
ncbi:hypothetical protein JYB88_16140 [Shewanella cyperi]|uniref:Uncharacterized protein n=1 Tax=Shewanella cyperi TaxID=2814292 RepID=A0A975AK23_9GAMM|nr:hypothetical protein [Shewanella cyperi]QSX29700.1 hypothetical protein JYB88_16140 [Shewanella cyperi]